MDEAIPKGSAWNMDIDCRQRLFLRRIPTGKEREVKKVYFIVSDGLSGMDEAIVRNFPEAKDKDFLLFEESLRDMF